MDYKQLEFFLTVCKEQSIGKAAAVSFVSQQAVSKSIANLEKELGVQLLVRSQGGVRLTEAGKLLERKVTPHMHEHEEIVRLMRSFNEGKQFRIGFYMGFLQTLPQHFFNDLQTKHPDVNFHFSSYTDNERARHLINQDCDLFISTASVSNAEFDLLLKLGVPAGIIMEKNNVLASRDEVYIDDLKGVPIIVMNSENRAVNNLQKLLRAHGLVADSMLGDSDQELVMDLLRRGFVSFYAGKRKSLPEDIVYRVVKNLVVYWELYIYGRRNAWHTELQKELTNEIREAVLN